MEYVAIGILAILVIGGGFTALTLRATAGSTPASPESGDSTPVGDTPQHSDADAEARGGTGGPTSGDGGNTGRAPSQEPDEPEGNRFKRDPIGGEAEAEPTIDTGDTPRPR
jgi:hypothetical protein